MHTIHAQDGEPPGPDAVSAALLIADLAELEVRYRRQVGREMYALGHARGWHDGYEAAGRDMASRWDEVTRPAVRGTSYDELELKRWGPGGRAHFGDSRPGDFPGREASAA